MNSLLSFIVFTSNILGSFNDPFEFDGDYGEQTAPIRQSVFEQVVAKEALASNLTDSQIEELMFLENTTFETIEQYRHKLITKAFQADLQHGPTLQELVSTALLEQIMHKQQELQANCLFEIDFIPLLDFIERYKDQKIFAFLRHCPPDLLSLDKMLRDQAARAGRDFNLPILSSTEPLKGETAFELKSKLIDILFTQDTFKVTKPENNLKNVLQQLDSEFLKQYLGDEAKTQDLTVFTSATGQVFLYWLYQAMNLHLVSADAAMIPEINKVKELFADTLGNPQKRAYLFKEHLIAADASVVFTQESDAAVAQALTSDGPFYSVSLQNPADGTLIFLNEDHWEPVYEIVTIDDYEGYARGRLNVILATRKNTGEKFLLASCHGNSTRAEDGRLQITKVMEKFHKLVLLPENQHLQLIIGIDANTKSEHDVQLLHEHLTSLGLIATQVGPTTVKRRMVTVQHTKAGRFAVDEEDYLITLRPENGGQYQMVDPTIGFKATKPDPTVPLPNLHMPSDHYPVGATLINAI